GFSPTSGLVFCQHSPPEQGGKSFSTRDRDRTQVGSERLLVDPSVAPVLLAEMLARVRLEIGAGIRGFAAASCPPCPSPAPPRPPLRLGPRPPSGTPFAAGCGSAEPASQVLGRLPRAAPLRQGAIRPRPPVRGKAKPP